MILSKFYGAKLLSLLKVNESQNSIYIYANGEFNKEEKWIYENQEVQKLWFL